MKHNLKTISFMIASFKDITKTFGENNESIDFFKRQVNGLINIGQIENKDAVLVYDIIDKNNKNWADLKMSFNEYIKVMNKMTKIKNKDTIYYLTTELNNSKKISDKTKSLVLETLDIDEKDYQISDKNKDNDTFGTYKIKQTNSNTLTELEKFNNIVKNNGNYLIRIPNLNAFCSGDIYYYSYKLKNFLPEMKKDNEKGIPLLKALNSHCFQIGTEVNLSSGDPCRGGIEGRTVFEPRLKLESQFKKIKWGELYKEYCASIEKDKEDVEYDY